jgi:hypothetical protein
VRGKVYEIAAELKLLAVSSCKRPIDLITNPGLVYNHSNTWQLLSEVVELEAAVGNHRIQVTMLVLSPSRKSIPRLSYPWGATPLLPVTEHQLRLYCPGLTAKLLVTAMLQISIHLPWSRISFLTVSLRLLEVLPLLKGTEIGPQPRYKFA